MNQPLNTDGCIRLVGEVIRRAIQDCCCTNKSKESGLIIDDAKDFIFNGSRLEKFFQSYGMLEMINCEYIRVEATKIINGEKLLGELDLRNK